MSFRSSTIAVALVAAAACHASTKPAPAAASPQVSPSVGQLRRDLETVLNDPVLSRATWGVLVQSLQNGETLFAWNPEKLLLPASNMKLVTLAAAAAELGWDYTYRTRLLMRGSINAGVLTGDLIVVGSGDPSIGNIDGSADRVFNDWADRLTQLGVRTVDGRIVGDDNAFDDEILGFGWSWDDLTEDYAAGVGALQFNENAIRVSISPGPTPGSPGAISVEPPESGIVVINSISTGQSGAAANLSAHRLPGQRTLVVAGTIPAGATPTALTLAVDNPTLFFVQALRRALIARGIDVRGPAVDIDDVPGHPAPTTAVAEHRSPPLSVLAMRLMRVSQNQYAETFLKTLALDRTPREASAERDGEGGTQATAIKGRTVAQKLFQDWGVDNSSLIIRDGSGLSRYDYLTAQALVTILTHVYKDPKLYAPFAASLPTPGTDGTLANRLKGSAAENRLRAKTGSMSQVRTLSGYITTSDDEPLVFSILANNFNTTADVINRATDTIVVKLAEFSRRRFGSAPVPPQGSRLGYQ